MREGSRRTVDVVCRLRIGKSRLQVAVAYIAEMLLVQKDTFAYADIKDVLPWHG